MVGQTKLMKTVWYPRIHQIQQSYLHGLETGVVNQWTHQPIAFQDEGKGAPSGFSANPSNAAFAEAIEANCYPDSRIDTIKGHIMVALTKAALETDKLHIVEFAYMFVHCAFLEDYVAIDELSQLEVQDVLEMQTESTDRQAYPLYNTVKLVEKYTNSGLMPTTHPGLTAGQIIEGVAFDSNQYYDMIQYMTNGPKLRACSSGIRRITLTKDRPWAKINVFIKSNVKRMNPYTALGFMSGVDSVDTLFQNPRSGDTTNISHVSVDVRLRYLEWNQEFDFGRV